MNERKKTLFNFLIGMFLWSSVTLVDARPNDNRLAAVGTVTAAQNTTQTLVTQRSAFAGTPFVFDFNAPATKFTKTNGDLTLTIEGFGVYNPGAVAPALPTDRTPTTVTIGNPSTSYKIIPNDKDIGQVVNNAMTRGLFYLRTSGSMDLLELYFEHALRRGYSSDHYNFGTYLYISTNPPGTTVPVINDFILLVLIENTLQNSVEYNQTSKTTATGIKTIQSDPNQGIVSCDVFYSAPNQTPVNPAPTVAAASYLLTLFSCNPSLLGQEVLNRDSFDSFSHFLHTNFDPLILLQFHWVLENPTKFKQIRINIKNAFRTLFEIIDEKTQKIQEKRTLENEQADLQTLKSKQSEIADLNHQADGLSVALDEAIEPLDYQTDFLKHYASKKTGLSFQANRPNTQVQFISTFDVLRDLLNKKIADLDAQTQGGQDSLTFGETNPQGPQNTRLQNQSSKLGRRSLVSDGSADGEG